jgi:hemoglobin
MSSADLCTEDEIVQLVYGFYDNVREDEMLGPIFNRHVKDWDTHLPIMVDFWSSALRGTARFRGAPIPKHAALPDLTIELFERWLLLLGQTTDALPNAALGDRAKDLAKRIAQSLWHGYQMKQDMSALTAESA